MHKIRLAYRTAICMAASTLVGTASADDADYPNHPFYEASGRHAGVYLCVPEVSGGLQFDDPSRQWRPTSFDVRPTATLLFKFDLNMTWVGLNGTKYKAAAYKVSINRPGDKDVEYCTAKTRVNGEAIPTYEMLTYISNDEQVLCSSTHRDYALNLRTLRYMSVDPRGYVDGYDEANSFSPSITVGKCSKVE